MKPSVLIVDDHPGFRASARRMLESEGYEVVGEAVDGLGGISAAADLAPELVLLDVQLPDMDGFEVAARLTTNGDGPAVVLTSTRDGEEFGSLVADSGARGFVPKDELSAESIEELIA